MPDIKKAKAQISSMLSSIDSHPKTGAWELLCELLAEHIDTLEELDGTVRQVCREKGWDEIGIESPV